MNSLISVILVYVMEEVGVTTLYLRIMQTEKIVIRKAENVC